MQRVGCCHSWKFGRPVLRTICKLPLGYTGETDGDWAQILQGVVGVDAHEKKDVLAEVGGVHEVDELVSNVVESSFM